MKILVCSCDKNEDTFIPFHHCIEKYWQDHPEIIYTTESVTNPYYRTICKNEPIWTRRIRETLNEIEDNQILLMVDDIFIRDYVDTKRIEYLQSQLKGNIAMFNFEKSFDSNDIETNVDGFKKRNRGSNYELSIMCGLWDKEKLLNVIKDDSSIWEVEYKQNTCGYDYYINSGEYIIDWGYRTWQYVGICKGKWTKETLEFFKKEKIEIETNRETMEG